MNQNKVHSQGQIPFAWENQPGISKVKHPSDVRAEYTLTKLPPPPCQLDSSHDIHQVPLQPPLRSSSKKGPQEDDPFFAAYKECTKSVKQGKLRKSSKKIGGSRDVRIGSLFSCKHSCGVREDSLVNRPPSVTRERFDFDAESKQSGFVKFI